MKKSLLSFLFLIQLQICMGQVVLNTNVGATSLVNNLVGSGINISNATGQFAQSSKATFTNSGVTGFSMPSGIILSTGVLTNFNGTSTGLNSTDLGLPGDPQLDALSLGGGTEDANILEFDFAVASDSAEFEFIFSSEEYNEFATTAFTDVFGFFITGPGYTTNTNLAVLPGTSTPISINTVNNGYSIGASSGPCTNCNYYIDNVGTGAVALSNDGFTVPIKIKFAIQPCATYHIKMAIADVGDGFYDSQVIIRSSSFESLGVVQVLHNGSPAISPMNLCAGGSLILCSPTASNYGWTTGDTTQCIMVTAPGTYEMYIANGFCFAYSNQLQIVSSGNITAPVIVQNGLTLTMTGTAPGGTTYQWFKGFAPVAGQTLSSYTPPSLGCYRLAIYNSNCEALSNEICTGTTGFAENGTETFSIYPNPVSNSATISTGFDSGTTTEYSLVDMTGRTVIQKSRVNTPSFEIQKGNLPAGVYLLELQNNNNNEISRQKIVFN
jgi:Secretion system C-terminal sorting domain